MRAKFIEIGQAVLAPRQVEDNCDIPTKKYKTEDGVREPV